MIGFWARILVEAAGLQRVHVWKFLRFEVAGRAVCVQLSADIIFSALNTLVGAIAIVHECEAYLKVRLCMHTKTLTRGCIGLAGWKQVQVDSRWWLIGDEFLVLERQSIGSIRTLSRTIKACMSWAFW